MRDFHLPNAYDSGYSDKLEVGLPVIWSRRSGRIAHVCNFTQMPDGKCVDISIEYKRGNGVTLTPLTYGQLKSAKRVDISTHVAPQPMTSVDISTQTDGEVRAITTPTPQLPPPPVYDLSDEELAKLL